jgi:uncharacterized membrane protein HdeD (DUF308 family)
MTNKAGSARSAGVNIDWAQENLERPSWPVMLAAVGLIIAGAFLLLASASALRVLFLVLAAYWLITGLVELIAAGRAGRRNYGRLRFIAALLAVIMGAVILFSLWRGEIIAPELSRYLLAITALLVGAVNFRVGWGSRGEPHSPGRLALAGVYVLLGVIMLFNPELLGSLLLPVVGLLMIAAGLFVIYKVYRARSGSPEAVAAAAAAQAASQVAQAGDPRTAAMASANADLDAIAAQAKATPLGPAPVAPTPESPAAPPQDGNQHP